MYVSEKCSTKGPFIKKHRPWTYKSPAQTLLIHVFYLCILKIYPIYQQQSSKETKCLLRTH